MLRCFPVALGSIPPMCHRPGYSDERALGNPHLPFRKCGVFLGPDRRKHFNIYSCRVTRKLHRYYGTHDLGRCGSTFRSGRRRSSVLPSRVLQMLRAHSFAKYTNEWGTRLAHLSLDKSKVWRPTYHGLMRSTSRLRKKSISKSDYPRSGICVRLVTAKPRRQTYMVAASVSTPAIGHLSQWKPPLG